MKSNYHERQANRLNAFLSLARKNKDLSISAYSTAKKLGDMIPMGQPILVGHYSEKGHRAHLSRIDNAMRKSVDASDKSSYYAERAASIENNRAINSDNPDALEMLEKKLVSLIKKQDTFKACNKIVKSKKLSEAQKIADLVKLGLSENTAAEFIKPDQWGYVGVPSYTLTNNNAKIKATKDRIAHLQKLAKIETSETVINGVKLVINAEDNRVQMLFGGKPSEEIRQKCKAAGFRFCYENSAWQRQISNHAVYLAKQILNSLSDANPIN